MGFKSKNEFIAYLGILVFALLFLFFGNRIATSDFEIYSHDDGMIVVEARVSSILGIVGGNDEWFNFENLEFEAQITRGEHRNETIIASQPLDAFWGLDAREVTVGDRVLLVTFADEDVWYFMDYIRLNNLLLLGGLFAVLLLIFGRIKGLNAILSLGFTCAAIFAIFIPSILSGRNIYMSVIIVCVYAIVVTLFLLNGINKKSLAAIVGCLGGVIAASLITLFMSQILLLTGMVDSESRHLLFLPTENPIDLVAIIFAGIIIGAVGAVMDVAVSISSALWELKEQVSNMASKNMFKSGMNIGKDIMGSMTNTLVLAYIGSSLTIILLLIVHTGSLAELLNRELIVVEILQALVGSMGILLTIPVTALACALLFPQKSKIVTMSENNVASVVDDDVLPSIPENEPELFKPALEDFFGEKAGWGHEAKGERDRQK